MKKLILIISVLMVLTITVVAFVGCSNVNQLSMLSIGWLDYESYVYDVALTQNDTSTTVGEMTYTFKRLINATETLNGHEYSLASGGYCEYNLNITSGEYLGSKIYSKVIFDSNFAPLASYKKYDSSDNSLDYEVFTDYSGKKKGNITINGETSTFKKSSGTYDNESMYTIIRGSIFEPAQSYSLSMRVPNNQSAEVATISVGKVSSEIEVSTLFKGEGDKSIVFKCSQFRVTAPSEYGSATYTEMYFSNEAYKYQNKDLIKIPCKIVEGDYVYTLKAISITE